MASGLVFSEQFLQLSAHLPSNYIYGLGEHATPWKLNTNYSKLTLFARDVPPDPVDDVRNDNIVFWVIFIARKFKFKIFCITLNFTH